VPGTFTVDAHAAHRVDCEIAIVFAAMFAAAAGSVRFGAVTMARLRSAGFM
jgi:hypothetical protein